MDLEFNTRITFYDTLEGDVAREHCSQSKCYNVSVLVIFIKSNVVALSDINCVCLRL